MARTIAVLLACVAFVISTASAAGAVPQGATHDVQGYTQATVQVGSRDRVHRGRLRHYAQDGGQRQAQILGGRPAGCPRQYCGCGASIKVFGRIRPELNLAANWIRKFPRTVAAPGMAAARSGHVMLLVEHVRGDKWKVWDANSGGGLTRIHVRSIRGFAVVNPHGETMARAAL